MRHLLLRLMHEMGTGRAIDNARREHDEVARTMAAIDALAGRLPAVASGPERGTSPMTAPVERRVAA
jgi:hypothetical protein